MRKEITWEHLEESMEQVRNMEDVCTSSRGMERMTISEQRMLLRKFEEGKAEHEQVEDNGHAEPALDDSDKDEETQRMKLCMKDGDTGTSSCQEESTD